MYESSDNLNPNYETAEKSSQKDENPPNSLDSESGEKGLLSRINLEKLAEKLAEIASKPKVTFDDEKWMKICKITKNILMANLKQYNNIEHKNELATMNPVVVCDNLNITTPYTPSLPQQAIALWNLNTLEFISLAAGCRMEPLSLSFKVVDAPQTHQKFDYSHSRHKLIHKIPPITIQGKQFKYDSTQHQQERNLHEPKGRMLERFNMKGDVKIPPNWDKRAGYEHTNWDVPNNYNTGSIFSLGPIKNEKKPPNDPDMISATNALKNLSCLVPDFQFTKKTSSDGAKEEITQMNINDICNFSFVDDDVDDSLKCSRFSKFFKVLKDQQTVLLMMESRIFKLLFFIKILLYINFYTSQNGYILAKNTENDRLEIFKRAQKLRYGNYKNGMNPYPSIAMFEELSDGYSDDIAQESLFELGTIHLLGYKRFFKIRYDIPKATHYFLKSAELGHPKSQYFLSFLFYHEIKDGPVVNKNKALRYLKSSSKSGYLPAILALSFYYLYHDVSSNVDYAIRLYKQVLTEDSLYLVNSIVPLESLKLSEYSLEAYRQDVKSYIKMEQRTKPSDLQDPKTYTEKSDKKCNMASKECKEAKNPFQEKIDEFEKNLAPENMSSSLVELATMYMAGINVPKNYEKTVQLLQRAVSLGNTEAANFLGNIYFFGAKDPDQGRSIPVNYDLALKYFRISAASQDAESFFFIAEILTIKAKRRGSNYFYLELPYIYHFYRLSADYGYWRGYVRCAQMLEVGLGTEADPVKSALDYKTVAEQAYINEFFYQSFYYLINGNAHGSCILNALSAYSGLSAGQWNAGNLLFNSKSSVLSDKAMKSFLNDSLLQGETDSLYFLAKIAEKEGKSGVAQDLYQKGFNAGDLKCLDPLIKFKSRSDFSKAVDLLEYKKYLDNVEVNNGNQGLLNNYFNALGSNLSIGALKVKKYVYNLLH